MRSSITRYLAPILSLCLMAAALWVLDTEVRDITYRDVMTALEAIPAPALLGALALTALNYLIFAGYELLACRYIDKPQPFRRIALSSFVGNAFANTFGFSFLSGSTVKFRLYTAWGLDAADVARVAGFTTLTLWLGLLTLGGPAMAICDGGFWKPAGVLLGAIPWLYVLTAGRWRQDFSVMGLRLPSPGRAVALGQIALSALDWTLAGTVLYVLLPSHYGFADFFGRFLLAQFAGVVSQSPGGIGVFESAFLLSWPNAGDNHNLVGCLLAFRIVYYLIPLLLAALALAAREITSAKPIVGTLARASVRWGATLAPNFLAISTFLAGAVLLVSGATPGVPWRLKWVLTAVPLPLLETSHFLGSVAGMSLLFLARGIQRKLDAAYHATIILLGVGIAASLLKGFDYEEALILGCMLLAFLPNRKIFNRTTSLFSARFTPGWIMSILLVSLTTVWLLLFAFKHVEYSTDLWWTFTLKAEASRSLRAEVGAMIAAMAWGWWRLMRPVPYRPEPSTPERNRVVREIVAASPETRSSLALLGDKELLLSPGGNSFLMFGISGRSWVSMGDPVGAPGEIEELAWTFHELCDRHRARAVFYEVGKENLPLYLDLGMSILKLGEEAIVDLRAFSLDGAAHKNLRNTRNSLEKKGCALEVVPAEAFDGIEPELRAISDSWLAQKNTREKRFSLGRYDPAYLSSFPTAVIRQEGRIVAFANLWSAPAGGELSIDLMRFGAEAPPGVMDYLFLKLMLWGREQGYARFNLGMAPFSGLSRHPLGPVWNRFGRFLYAHAEEYYNFNGLRKYKEKFDPDWEPRFIALPGGLGLPVVLANVASLISGGITGVIGK